MKNILVPTDFSRNAENALTRAIEIANRTGAEVHLLHTYQVAQNALVFKDIGGLMERDAMEDMQRLVEKFRPRMKQPERLTGDVVRGGLVGTVARYGRDHLIVMGTRGATDALEVFIGSTTGAVLKQAGQPVLAIPADCNYQNLDRIVLALDSQPLPDRATFEPLHQLAAAFGAEVLVFHLVTDEDDEGIDPAIRDYLPDLPLSFHQLLDDDRDINESINAFLAEQEADMLCMIRRKRGFLQSLFQGSSTTRQVYNSPAPLLVLMDAKAA